jgi:Zn-finger nucleic acid-binding protein
MTVKTGIADADPSFYLEKCPKCYGIWFDKDEWERISKELIEQNLLSIWSVSYQREQRTLKKKSKNEETYTNALGEDLYSSIVQLTKIIKDHPEKHWALELFNEQLKK